MKSAKITATAARTRVKIAVITTIVQIRASTENRKNGGQNSTSSYNNIKMNKITQVAK